MWEPGIDFRKNHSFAALGQRAHQSMLSITGVEVGWGVLFFTTVVVINIRCRLSLICTGFCDPVHRVHVSMRILARVAN